MKRKRAFTTVISAILAVSFAFNLSGCSETAQAADLMENTDRREVSKRKLDDDFINSNMDFAVKLFQNAADKEENSLVSPLSVALCMGMVANGADGETKSQIEAALGGLKTDDLNEYLYTYVKELSKNEDSKINIANSIWYRDSDSLSIEKEFLQTTADYYNASAYKKAFDFSTVDEINGWVKKNTDSMIKKIVDKIDPDAVAYLINAIAFEAAWETAYSDFDYRTFTNYDNTNKTVKMMPSVEDVYISDDNAVGFLKYYSGPYAFAAILPNEGVDINDYVNSMTGEGLRKMLSEREHADVYAKLPQFKYDYDINLNDSLVAMGVSDAFLSNAADFSKMGKSGNGPIYINSVLHKTHIEVDEKGTKAAAVTAVVAKASAAMPIEKNKYYVDLNRPFVYMIIDTRNNLPIFMGKVMELDS